jgi:hypothetical protein
MYVTIYQRAAAARLVIPAQFTKRPSIAGSFGSGQITFDRTSRAWRDDILSREGGQLIRIRDQREVFTGVGQEPQWSGDTVTIRVVDINEWVGHRVLTRRRVFRACPAGLIARRAAEDAFLGSGVLPVTIGPCALGAPLLRRFEFTGRETAQTVLKRLTDETGHEWNIDHDTYEFRWQPETGRYREGLLVDLGDLFPNYTGRPLDERYREVIEVDGRTKRSFRALNMTTPALHTKQTVVEV